MIDVSSVLIAAAQKAFTIVCDYEKMTLTYGVTLRMDKRNRVYLPEYFGLVRKYLSLKEVMTYFLGDAASDNVTII